MGRAFEGGQAGARRVGLPAIQASGLIWFDLIGFALIRLDYGLIGKEAVRQRFLNDCGPRGSIITSRVTRSLTISFRLIFASRPELWMGLPDLQFPTLCEVDGIPKGSHGQEYRRWV